MDESLSSCFAGSQEDTGRRERRGRSGYTAWSICSGSESTLSDSIRRHGTTDHNAMIENACTSVNCYYIYEYNDASRDRGLACTALQLAPL